ncbi:MAG: serine/threonine protein kinase [Frankiales bacterium]|nr:serine/threonine protein kinase [Frankiales bacterium]
MTTGDPAAGARLLDGRYRLGDRLGGGAVADVYRGQDERLQRPVAVKLFRGDAAEQLQRHDAEMLTLAALDHPSLVTVFDAGTDAETDQPFLVMQLVEGPTLSEELKEGPLPGERAARYGAALADALGYVHERGLVHRDVKPGNVLISTDGRVHLADFGIARLVDAAHETRTGDVLGTPAYFAPEQVAGEAVGPPADIYALGIVLIECLTGKRPFEGTAMEVAMARLARDPDVPEAFGPDWRDLLSAMTRRNPGDRPAATAVADGLRAIADGGSLDRTVAMPPVTAATTATTAMPAATTAMAQPTTAMAPLGATTVLPPTSAQPAPAVVRRRGPTPAVIALIVVLVLAAAAAAVYAVHRNNTNHASAVHHGKPHLHQPLEHDLRHLEDLVHP